MTRTSSDSAAFMNYIDSCKQVQVKALAAKCGWMGKSLIGYYNQVLYLIIQHYDLSTQEKYFPLLQESVDKGESSKTNAAMLHDSIIMGQRKKEIYGSQVVFNKTGGQEFYPIEDENKFEERKVGLQPIEEYAKYFGIDYKLPTK